MLFRLIDILGPTGPENTANPPRSDHLVSEHLFSLSFQRLEKHAVISSAEVRVISDCPWVCAGPKKSKKEPKRGEREGGWESHGGSGGGRTEKEREEGRVSPTTLPTWWKEMKMTSDSSTIDYNSCSSCRCQFNFCFDFTQYL